MASKKPVRKGTSNEKRFHYLNAVAAWEGAIQRNLEDLKKPINQSGSGPMYDKAMKDIKDLLAEMYKNTKIVLAQGSMIVDPSGILTNQTIFVRCPEMKAQYPHWPYVQKFNQDLIQEDTEMTTKTDTTINDVVNTPEAPVEDTKMKKTPIAQGVEKEMPTTEAPVVSFNDSFHLTYTTQIDTLLSEMNDVFDDEELKGLRTKLGGVIREWVEQFYFHVLNEDAKNRITADNMNLLSATTKYSSPDYHSKYDNAHLVDKLIARVNDKYKVNNGCESSMFILATALLDAQDTTKKTFSIEMENGETIEVNKETKQTVVKKDGVVVHYAKKAYEGVKNFFKGIWNYMVRFKNWIVSWFTKNDKEERIDVSPEQAKAMEEEALRKVAEGKIA